MTTAKKPTGEGSKYLAIIESMEVTLEPPPFSLDEKREIRRLIRDEDRDQDAAEKEVLEARVASDSEDEDGFVEQAILRHRSYLPFVEAGTMTIYEAVREVGANRSADGRGQERT